VPLLLWFVPVALAYLSFAVEVEVRVHIPEEAILWSLLDKLWLKGVPVPGEVVVDELHLSADKDVTDAPRLSVCASDIEQTHWPARWYLRGPLCGVIMMVPVGFVALATPECGQW
jgi:hypothetical protein